jgi:hypothetical protein
MHHGKKRGTRGACLLSSRVASEVPHPARVSSFLEWSPAGSWISKIDFSNIDRKVTSTSQVIKSNIKKSKSTQAPASRSGRRHPCRSPRLQGTSPALQGAVGEENGICMGSSPAAAPELLHTSGREEQAVRSLERATAEVTSTSRRCNPPRRVRRASERLAAGSGGAGSRLRALHRAAASSSAGATANLTAVARVVGEEHPEVLPSTDLASLVVPSCSPVARRSPRGRGMCGMRGEARQS